MNATIELVSALVAVGETSSFSAAAKRLGVSTGTISRAIARLESEVGAQLVHRTTRTVSLSTAGHALYERAAAHVHGIEVALKNLPEGQEEPAGVLRLSASSDVGSTFLPEVLARYLARYPEVKVECDITSRRVDLIGEGFDLALRASMGREKDSSLVMRRTISVEARAYAAPEYLARRGTPREIGEKGHEWMAPAGVKKVLKLAHLELRVLGNDMLFLREAARVGIGIALLPSFVAEPLVLSGGLVEVLPKARLLSGVITLVYPQAEQVPRKVTAFRDILLAMTGRT